MGSSVQDVTARAKQLISERKYRDAVRACRRVLLSKPDAVPVRLLLAQALLALGRHDEVRIEMLALSKKAFIGKGPIDFEHVLYDPVNLKYFKDFCVSEMSTENLLFWLEVEDYKDIKEAAITVALHYGGCCARMYAAYQGSRFDQVGLDTEDERVSWILPVVDEGDRCIADCRRETYVRLWQRTVTRWCIVNYWIKRTGESQGGANAPIGARASAALKRWPHASSRSFVSSATRSATAPRARSRSRSITPSTR